MCFYYVLLRIKSARDIDIPEANPLYIIPILRSCTKYEMKKSQAPFPPKKITIFSVGTKKVTFYTADHFLSGKVDRCRKICLSRQVISFLPSKGWPLC